MIDVGQMVISHLERKDISQAQLAKKLKALPQNLNRKLRADDMSVSLLMNISVALEHDFFKELSLEYKKLTFNAASVASEPDEKYGAGPLEQIIRQVVKDEIQKSKKG